MNTVSAHVGKRIKLYRKNKNITLKQFSEMIHKSVSTISKYENGEIAIDVDTLFEIAEALGISMNQLTDYSVPRKERAISASARGFFNEESVLYLYYYRQEAGKINRCVLEISNGGEMQNVILYVNISDMTNYHSCRYLYYGDMSYSDIYTNFSLENQVNPIEKLFLCVMNPIDKGDLAYGIISGISSKYLKPISYKFIISKCMLRENEDLIKKLKLSKEDIRVIKRTNAFLIDDMLHW